MKIRRLVKPIENSRGTRALPGSVPRALAQVFNLCAAAIIFSQAAQAQGWFTVDDFQYTLGKSSAVGGSVPTGSPAIAADAQGNVFVAGFGFDGSLWHGLVMISPDQAANWTVSDDYFVPGTFRSEFRAIGIDTAGNLYTSGQTGTNFTWMVRKSADHGATWTTVMSDLDGFQIMAPTSIAADSLDRIFITATISNNWIVRASSDAGATWATVDKVAGARPMGMVSTSAGVFVVGNNGQVRKSADEGGTWTTVDTSTISPAAICADTLGNLYLGGTAVSTSGKGSKTMTTCYWVIRRSLNSGATWLTVATIPVAVNTSAPLYAVGTDAAGNVYAIGNGLGGWLVQKSSDHGVSWSVVDNFQYGSGATPTCFARDTFGNLYVGGRGSDSSGALHWIVRKHSAS